MQRNPKTSTEKSALRHDAEDDAKALGQRLGPDLALPGRVSQVSAEKKGGLEPVQGEVFVKRLPTKLIPTSRLSET